MVGRRAQCWQSCRMTRRTLMTHKHKKGYPKADSARRPSWLSCRQFNYLILDSRDCLSKKRSLNEVATSVWGTAWPGRTRSPANQNWCHEINASEACREGVNPIVRHRAKSYERELHIIECPFILASLRHNFTIFMPFNQHLDMPHLWGGTNYLGKAECSITQI